MRIKESKEGFEITFEYNRKLAFYAKKLLSVCPGSYKDMQRKSYFFPKTYAPAGL